MKLIIFLIPILSITHSLFPMYINKIPNDVVAQIISKPDMAALEKIEIYNQHKLFDYEFVRVKQHKIPYQQTRNALIPCFKLLLTCTRYYNNSFKNKVIDTLTAYYFPQGIMFFLLPKWIQLETLTEIPDETHIDQSMPLSLFQKEQAVKKLANLCPRSNITHDKLFAATKSLRGSFNDIIYLLDNDDIQSYTLIEYLENILVLQLDPRHQSFAYVLMGPILENFLILIDSLCLSGKIDLALPVVLISHQSIEGYICDLHQYSGNNAPFTNLNLGIYIRNPHQHSEEHNAPFSVIPFLSPEAPVKSIYARPPEHQYIIKALANLFLFPSPKDRTLVKKELQQEKKEFYDKLGFYMLLSFTIAITLIFKNL